MAKKVFTDESLATFVDEIKAYTDDAVSGKANSSHTHKYAGSSSAGGAATSANKLNTDAGSTTQPVYFANGIPVKTTYTLGKSVPSDAVFTDTKYNNATTTADGLMSLEDKTKLNTTNIAYGTCTTAAATAAKVITISGNTQWALAAGSMITVLFSNTNTAENPTFNVNGTGAKNVFYSNAQIKTSSLSYAGYKSRPMNFMYDGTQYIFIGWGADSNTDTKVQQNAAITTAGEYPVVLAYSTATSKVTNAVNKTSTLTYNPSTKILTAPTFKGALNGNADTATSATSATKATQDASGNVITSTYATKTELDTAKTNLQGQLDGKAASGHTHNYAGSSSAGGAATSANKVNSSLTVKLNGGATEGTNMFTFNGSAAKSVNITPSGIGAATSSHTHDDRYYTETEIDSKVSTLNTAISGKAASSHTHVIDDVTNLQSSLDAKQATVTGAATTITGSNLTASRALISNSSGKVAVSAVTSTELGYLDGVTSNVQTQLDGKATSSHAHGNITNAGAIGTASGKAVITTTNGVLTTGTVPIASGGTGATTAAAALTNLGLTATAAELNIMDGVTATAAEINKLDGLTATTTELNYVDGVTSNIQTQLDGKAASSHNHSAANITSGTIAAARLPAASGTAAGITIVYPAASCTTFSSDSGTVTPLAVQKGAKMFAITRPSSSTEHAVVRYTNTTGDVENSKIIIEDVTNTKDTSKTANVLAIPAEGGKKMVYGYCTDQTDGTSFIGGVFASDATEYPYAQGLAIGGTSGNLLWKGNKVIDATGGQLSGNLTVSNSSPSISVVDTDKDTQGAFWQNGNQTILSNRNVKGSTSNHRSIVINNSVQTSEINSALRLYTSTDGTATWYNILHTGNVTVGTADITAGANALATGAQYLVYE